MTKFINPFTDVGFKKIFGQEMTKDLLIDFLNDLLVDEKHIIDITFLDKEILPEYMGDRGVIYDIYCRTSSMYTFVNVPCITFQRLLPGRVRKEPNGSLT